MAAALRFYGLDWDGGLGAHPDERYVVGVAESLRWPDRLNPFDVAPDYAYGHLPLYLLALAGSLAQGTDCLLVGRALTALFDLGTVALTFALARRVYGEKVGLLAAAFVALMVSHVQQAHFYTVDAPLTFFVLGALLFASRLAESGRSRDALLAGAWAGLALGCKFSTALLILPLGAALTIRPSRQARGLSLLRCGGAALAAFALTNPFALANLPVFWRNLAQQANIARGLLDVPYTRQFHGTWPYLYPIVQQLRWGMGWALGLVAFGGLAYSVWRAVREPPRRAEWVLLAWALPYLAFTGALYVKFPRYLLPLTPLLAIYGARLLLRASAPLRRCAIVLVLTCSLLRSLAFVNLYRSPHPWLAASEWLYEQAEPGAAVAVEQWDHPLPLDATGYNVRELPIFDEETPEKWGEIAEILAQTDYVVIASRRGYGALARWPERYPSTARYYRLLFENGMGFELAACFGRYPRLGPLALVDDPTAGLDFSLPALCQPEAPFLLRLRRLDESFVVYDHPQVVILRRYEAK
ncbi:MAG: hypothetical protein DRJ03_06595 [Chloroflexi bacterium]|nr:MAG: hypothetical protein DRJ03_06595 [Chloroflexota bacterium]